MGRKHEFFRSYHRKRLERASYPSMGNGGPYKGIEVKNVPPEIMLACSGESGIDGAMYQALHSTIDYDGLWDIIEMRQVADSHKAAFNANQRLGMQS